MPIIRKKLAPADVYPEDIRYNAETGQVQSLINGDWVDNPAADPRNQTTLPARLTAHPACDAAESVKDAFEGQINDVLTAIDGASTALTIAGIILSLFTFGPFAVLIDLALFLAHQMLDNGTSAIEAALTPTVYHQFACILFCHFDNPTGRLAHGELGAVEADIDAQIGGLAATVLNGMLNLAGEGGVNNLAALGGSTGDCSDCDCFTPCDITNWTLDTGTQVSKNTGTGHWVVDGVYSVDLFGGYGLIIQSAADDDCCRMAYTVLSGTVTVELKVSCGNPPYPTSSFSGGGGTDPQRSWLLASGAPFRVDMEFSPP